jgi:hypothetical protein
MPDTLFLCSMPKVPYIKVKQSCILFFWQEDEKFDVANNMHGVTSKISMKGIRTY